MFITILVFLTPDGFVNLLKVVSSGGLCKFLGKVHKRDIILQCNGILTIKRFFEK